MNEVNIASLVALAVLIVQTWKASRDRTLADQDKAEAERVKAEAAEKAAADLKVIEQRKLEAAERVAAKTDQVAADLARSAAVTETKLDGINVTVNGHASKAEQRIEELLADQALLIEEIDGLRALLSTKGRALILKGLQVPARRIRDKSGHHVHAEDADAKHKPEGGKR